MSEDPTRGHGFDELARSLAEGSISRRRALKLFAGTAIAALIPSRAMAITCPPDRPVKICHIPQEGGTCKRGQAETRCVTQENANRHLADHPCDCCGGCGGTDNCLDPKPETTCISTSSTTTTAAGTTSTTTTAAGTTSTTTTAMCKRIESSCDPNKVPDECCGDLVCRAGSRGGPVQCRKPLDT
jgi:hypothetical protein